MPANHDDDDKGDDDDDDDDEHNNDEDDDDGLNSDDTADPGYDWAVIKLIEPTEKRNDKSSKQDISQT